MTSTPTALADTRPALGRPAVARRASSTNAKAGQGFGDANRQLPPVIVLAIGCPVAAASADATVITTATAKTR